MNITGQPKQLVVEKIWGGDLKTLRFYNLLLVFDDLFDWVKRRTGSRITLSYLAWKTGWIMFTKWGVYLLLTK